MGTPSCCVVGPARAVLSPYQRVLLPKPSPQDKGSWHPAACADPILDGTPGGATFLERTSRVIGMALTWRTRSGDHHVSREVGLPDSLA